MTVTQVRSIGISSIYGHTHTPLSLCILMLCPSILFYPGSLVEEAVCVREKQRQKEERMMCSIKASTVCSHKFVEYGLTSAYPGPSDMAGRMRCSVLEE